MVLVSEGAFSVGIPFAYYVSREDDDRYVTIPRKYDNFEDEIREYDSKNFNYIVYKTKVLTKAKQYGFTIN